MGIGRDIAYAAGLAASSPVWAVSMLRTGKWRTDWVGRLGGAKPQAAGGAPRLLIHAVSVGEVNLVQQLVAQLAEEGVEVVLSATTNTGHARATALYGDQHAVVRWPLDFTGAVGRFLDAVRPDAVALVELEVWPNFMEACDRRGIPVAVINGRLSERSFKRYRLIAPLLRPTFAKLAAAAVQTPDYAARFEALGVAPDRVQVLDTMKWDAAQVADQVEGADELAAEMGIDRGAPGRPVVVAGSTGDGEEAALVEAVRRRCGEAVQVVVVPRKPERFDEVARALPGVVRRTETERLKPLRLGADVFLLDTLGELRKAYALADAVIVGRSFNGWGGSDPIEPIGLGRPTVIGPDHQNFADAVSALRQGGGIEAAGDIDEAAAHVAAWLADPRSASELAKRGRDVILSRQGATRRHAALLQAMLGRKRQ